MLEALRAKNPKGQQGGYAYHVINRSNGQIRSERFKKFKWFDPSSTSGQAKLTTSGVIVYRFTPFKTAET
jgi:hypothetical protein